jgi:hypothetical protein
MFLKFRAIWTEKWSRNIDNETLAIAIQEWSGVLRKLNPALINQTIEECKIIFVWPPSIAEFLEVYERQTGVPSMEEAVSSTVGKHRSCSFVSEMIDRIGTFTLTNQPAEAMRKRATLVYKEMISEIRRNLIEEIRND